MKIELHKYDIPSKLLENYDYISIDTEATGLNIHRDRLCLVQLKFSNIDTIHLVQFPKAIYNQSPNLKKLLKNNAMKLFHFAKFDMCMLYHYLKVMPKNCVCTRILSKVTRTFSDRHGLKDLCKEVKKIELNKASQCSDWGQEELSQSQKAYAASDVVHLHDIYNYLYDIAVRDNKANFIKEAFKILPFVVMCAVHHYNIDEFVHYNVNK